MILDSSKTKSFKMKCDYCGIEFSRRKYEVMKSRNIVEKDTCGSQTCRSKKRTESNLKKYGCKNPSQNKEIRKKQEETIFQKYGTKTPSKNKKVIEKMKATNMKRYGTSCSLHSEEVSKKKLDTWKAKYGCDHPFGSPLIREKIYESMRNRYGDHFTRTEEYREKSKKTCIKKYGKEHHAMCDEVKKKRKKTNMERYGGEAPAHDENVIKKMLLSKKGKIPIYGKTQKEIGSYLEEISGVVFKSHVVSNKEIDIFSDEKKLAVEYCGLYWHNENSPSPRDRKYHQIKYDMCKSIGIRLLTVFEDEWVNRKEQCKGHIASVVGFFERKFHARKCIVKEVPKKEANSFYSDFHIQGSPNGTVVSFGIFFGEEMLGCVSLSRHHRIKGEITISRLCFKSKVQVVGGASRLFKACRDWCVVTGTKKITTWSDNRWSEGNVYMKNGFLMEGELPPDYSYVDLKKRCVRISKQSMKKSSSGCPKEMTEKQWAEKNGFVRIWDCGKKRWVMNID